MGKPLIYPTIKEPQELKEFGSFKHSNFAHRILNRLTTTTRFLNAAVHGTQREKEAIFSIIHKAHTRVKGENYSADDPELHKWTAANLFAALVVVHEAFFGKLPRAKQEALYKEAAMYGTSLRMPPELWPATLDEFWQYWHRQIETLTVTDWARSLCRDLLWPRKIPLYLWPAVPVGRLLTIHWLPERLQREYGLPRPGPWSNAFYYSAVAGTALIYPHLPRTLRTLPSKMYMKDMKSAVKRIEATGTWHNKKD
ncbi:hypothetical protein PG985_015697 [Apiospora marii]|uniref:uncharacterized protein n=1 Tax=Apiospora marii TaxID=335849 RepID=UPI00312D1D9F